MSEPTLVLRIFVAWLLIWWVAPIGLSYFLLWRDECKAEGHAVRFFYHRPSFHG